MSRPVKRLPANRVVEHHDWRYLKVCAVANVGLAALVYLSEGHLW